MAISLILILLLIGVVSAVVAATRRKPESKPGGGNGDDLLAYFLLAVSVGVSAYSLAQLGQAAFPTGGFVFDPERKVASALAGLVVSLPVALFLWRRQRQRRVLYPNSPGWTLYLGVIEAGFMTAFAVTLFRVLDWIISTGDPVHVTDVVVAAGVVVFHEFAVRTTPPRSEAGELPRIIGSAVGLITLVSGLVITLTWVLSALYAAVFTELDPTPSWRSGLSAVIVGGLIWWYRWLRPWPSEAADPRQSWVFLVSTGGLAVTLGTIGAITARTLIYLIDANQPAGDFFEFLPAVLAVGVVGFLVWMHHVAKLGKERTDPRRAYEYSSAAIGLTAGVAGTTALVTVVTSNTLIVGSMREPAITWSVVLVIGMAVWFAFWSRAGRAPNETEVGSGPRRTYLLGLGVIMATVGAGALIATLVGVFQLILGVGGLSDNFPTTITLFLAAGGAAWHLLRTYARDKASLDTGESVAPFDVTVVCSHPGSLAVRFPSQARLRIVYRGDDAGVVDDVMGDQIVEAVANRSSYVWVDETGFRVAPAR